VPRHAARHRLLHLRLASGCFGTSRGLARDSSSTTSPLAGSASTTSLTPSVWVPRHVARLVTWLIVDYFTYAARPVASARHAACRVTRCRLFRLCRAFGCLDTSRGSSLRSSSTTSPTPRVRVPRHVARLLTRLVIDYFDFAARPCASARRAAHQATHRATRHGLLHQRHASGCLGTSRGSSCSSSSTTSPTPRVRVPRHVARLVTRLVVDYFTYAARPVALC
jgi:hypothetical protein